MTVRAVRFKNETVNICELNQHGFISSSVLVDYQTVALIVDMILSGDSVTRQAVSEHMTRDDLLGFLKQCIEENDQT